jgi:hypothetical protein
MATRPLIIDEDGSIARLPEGMPLQVNPALEDNEAPQWSQVLMSIQASVEASIKAMFEYKIQYSTEDIEAGVAQLPTGCVYLVYE